MVQGQILVLEGRAVDALPAKTVALSEVTTLDDEVLHHSVKDAALESADVRALYCIPGGQSHEPRKRCNFLLHPRIKHRAVNN